jgi:hypothetical protein
VAERQERMRLLSASKTGACIAGALALVAAVVTSVGTAVPAQAALSSGNWAEQALPANFVIADGSNGPALSPVSCVQGTRFCLVVAADQAVTVNGFSIGQGTLVTTDAGHTWTGYAGLPSTFRVTAVSCVSVSVCWAAGPGWEDEPHVAESTNGGQTWTDVSPPSWADALWWPNAIDCVSADTCYVAGTNNASDLQNPAAAKTTNGGASWTVFTNLPTFTSSDPNGTYVLNGISCISARSCVAAGGLNESDGTATVVSTTDGGSTWSRSLDPSLANVQQFFSVSCLRAGGVPACMGAGSALEAAGPVALASHDGGATWGGMQTLDTTGWLNSVSCATVRNCWAAGAGTSVSLAGTSNGGETWSTVTSDTTNQDGSVSCLSIKVCVATTDNGLWVTSNDGGLPWAG